MVLIQGVDDDSEDAIQFWTLLGGKQGIKSAGEGDAYEPEVIGEGVMLKLSDQVDPERRM